MDAGQLDAWKVYHRERKGYLHDEHSFLAGWQAATEKAQEQIDTLLEAMEFAASAIEDAIFLEDGLEGGTGEAVLEMMDKAAGHDLCSQKSQRISGKRLLAYHENAQEHEKAAVAQALAETVERCALAVHPEDFEKGSSEWCALTAAQQEIRAL